MNLFRIEETADSTCFEVCDDLDIATAPSLEKAVIEAEARGKQIVISLAHCKYVDSTGLSLFVRMKKKLANRLVLVVPEGNRARRIFEITQLATQLEICDALSQSIAS